VNVAAIIDAQTITITVANGTTGDDDAGNVLADNGNGTDTLNKIGYHRSCDINYHYTSNGYKWWKCTNYQSNYRNCSSACTPAGSYTYQICDKLNPTNAMPQR
jgi:hypothetical protein